MLTGSGAQNRDQELFGFRPFRVIADHLGKAGVAVLRYDDRGVGGSTGTIPGMAGSAERSDAVLRRQTEDLSKAAGGSDEAIAQILAAHRGLTEAIKASADRSSIVSALRVLVRAQLRTSSRSRF